MSSSTFRGPEAGKTSCPRERAHPPSTLGSGQVSVGYRGTEVSVALLQAGSLRGYEWSFVKLGMILQFSKKTGCLGYVTYKLALAIYLCKDQITSHYSCWPSTPPERSSGWSSGMRHSVLWKKNWQNGSSDRYFQEKILWAQFLHLLVSRKALQSFMVTSAPRD